MAFNEELDARISSLVSSWGRIERKKMFGGTCYLMNGNMFCGVYKDSLIVKLGVDQAARALEEPSVKIMDFTGRQMKGWIMVSAPGLEGDKLSRWLKKGRTFAEALPPKEPGKGAPGGGNSSGSEESRGR